LEFGLSIPHYGGPVDPGLLRETAQQAEALGFASLWVGDHIITPEHFARAVGAHFYEAFVTLSHLSAWTRSVRLGTSVVVLPYRHPLVTAKMAATLDALSGGRLVFGIGAGNAPDEFAALGLPERERGGRTDEYLDAMLALWTQDPASFHGRYTDFANVHFQPKPVQKPRIPIWVGGHSKAALRRAVKYGEAWHSGGMSPERMAEVVAELRNLAAESGRAAGPAATTRLTVRLAASPASAGSERRPGRGTPDEVLADFRRYSALGVSAIVCDLGPKVGADLHGAMQRFTGEIACHWTSL
jgi:probable F420-dependent oxidoreductase